MGRARADAAAARRRVLARTAGGKTLRLEGRGQQQRGRGLRPRAAQEARRRLHQDRARPGLRDPARMTRNKSSPPSLRQRMLWLVLAMIALVSLLQATSAYRSALLEADRMFDYHLQEVARSVHGGLPFTPGGDEYEFSVRIWSPEGQELYRSGAREMPQQTELGFSDALVNRVRLRIYSLRTPEHTIQIAQDLDARSERARSLAWKAILPIVLFAPILMVAVWWLIDRSLAPVQRMRRQVAAREA